MARTYRDIAIEEMLETVEEAMSQAIDSVEFVKKALGRQVHETDRGKGPP